MSKRRQLGKIYSRDHSKGRDHSRSRNTLPQNKNSSIYSNKDPSRYSRSVYLNQTYSENINHQNDHHSKQTNKSIKHPSRVNHIDSKCHTIESKRQNNMIKQPAADLQRQSQSIKEAIGPNNKIRMESISESAVIERKKYKPEEISYSHYSETQEIPSNKFLCFKKSNQLILSDNSESNHEQSLKSSSLNIAKYAYYQPSSFSKANSRELSQKQNLHQQQNRVIQCSNKLFQGDCSKYVSSELGNGQNSQLFGDSLSMYENPMLKNREVVKKLSHLNNIFKQIANIKQEKLSKAITLQLKDIETEVLGVEKDILRNC